ncbi:MAG: hypothetical protein ACI9KK_002055 [Ascidiaceihabitans sp.]|jgi:hypothetical protein
MGIFNIPRQTTLTQLYGTFSLELSRKVSCRRNLASSTTLFKATTTLYQLANTKTLLRRLSLQTVLALHHQAAGNQ